MHGRGSSGTNVLCTIVGCLLCWANIGPDISRIATEIRTALMLRLLQPYYGIAASVRPLIKQFHKRPWLARAGSRKQDVNTNSDAQSRLAVYPTRSGRVLWVGLGAYVHGFSVSSFLPLRSTNRLLSTPSVIIRIITKYICTTSSIIIEKKTAPRWKGRNQGRVFRSH